VYRYTALAARVVLPLVAPDERRAHVHREIRRPTFARLERPLHEVCRYVAFSTLEETLERFGDGVRYMRPDFIESIAEPVA